MYSKGFIYFSLTTFCWRNPKLFKAAATAKSLQSCLTLCYPRDGSPPGSPVSGILQARTLEWVAISFSNAWKWNVKGKSLSRIWLLATPWTAAYQAPLFIGFSRQEYWSGVPLPSSFKAGGEISGKTIEGDIKRYRVIIMPSHCHRTFIDQFGTKRKGFVIKLI